jgi:hypothetical protein
VTAATSAGPSGVAGIACAIDGAPTQWYATSNAQIPVSGTGEHQVQCYAETNAVGADGVHGTSATESFQMKIGTPTVAAAGFTKLVDKLRCHHSAEHVRIPARWVTVKSTVDGSACTSGRTPNGSGSRAVMCAPPGGG